MVRILTPFAALTVLAVCPPAAAAAPRMLTSNEIAAIQEASAVFQLPASWIEALIAAESGGDPSAVSPAGALGLMQLMPGTWGELRVRLRLGPDPFDPHDNVLAGAAYLRAMFDRFGRSGAFAAYHAGPERYAQFLVGRLQLGPATRAYAARLSCSLGDAPGLAPSGLDWTVSPLFPRAGQNTSWARASPPCGARFRGLCTACSRNSLHRASPDQPAAAHGVIPE